MQDPKTKHKRLTDVELEMLGTISVAIHIYRLKDNTIF